MHDQKTKLKLKHIYLLFLKINKPKVWPPNGIMIHKVQMKITMLWHAIALFIYIWKQRIPPNLDDVRCFICVFGCVYFFFYKATNIWPTIFTKTVVLVGLVTNNNSNVSAIWEKQSYLAYIYLITISRNTPRTFYLEW